MTVAFEKWEGLGNDFVVLEAGPGAPLAEAVALPTAAVVALCDRRRGVGADGVLVVETAPGRRPRMVVFNADGSRPEMCGNGLRCVAGFLVARGATGEGPFVVDTDAGPRRCDVTRGDGGVFHVEVDMGVARFEEDLAVDLDGREHRFRRVDMGNPHAVTFAPYDDGAVDRVGPRVATTPVAGTNVEFCAARPDERGVIDVVVWERGVGRTLACGTGACAVAAIACEEGRATYGEPVRVHLPGGELVLHVERATREVRMRGPARQAFVGALRTLV
jgi:diaminopimelate epimerase